MNLLTALYLRPVGNCCNRSSNLLRGAAPMAMGDAGLCSSRWPRRGLDRAMSDKPDRNLPLSTSALQVRRSFPQGRAWPGACVHIPLFIFNVPLLLLPCPVFGTRGEACLLDCCEH